MAYTNKDADIIFDNRSIPDDEVSMYFDAADVVCLPFKTITTSGSVILAATYGKPIVTPRLGAIQDIPREVGVLYDPSQKDAVLHALEQALESPSRRQAMAAASRRYADTLSWDKIAASTYAVYLKALKKRIDSNGSRANSTM